MGIDKKIQSEFDQKLRESKHHAPEAPLPFGADKTASATGEAYVPEETIPVIEEQVRIDKKTVETGQVVVSKDVREHDVSVDLTTLQEEADVERVPVNAYVDEAPPAIRHEGNVTIIPVLQEELVVVKRLKVVEEIRITKRRVETHEPQQMTLRKEVVDIKREDPDGRPAHHT